MKRAFDFILSGISILILFPFFLIFATLIRVTLGSPIFFYQVRPGLHSKPFKMVKFRTMKNAVDNNGDPLPDAERLTKFGSLLRSLSIDELPELWNVLKGDMSLVGPRPLLTEYLPLYTEEQRRRHEVPPGITGWAQVNGRNNLSWEDKFRLDVWYVDNRSFWLDLKIIFLTIKKVIFRDGINASGEATMYAFTGTGTKDKKDDKPQSDS